MPSEGSGPEPVRTAVIQQPALSRGVPRTTAHLHRISRTAWIALDGDVAAPANARRAMRQLRTAQRRLPHDIDLVCIDLTGLREITVDMAAFIAVDRRLLAALGLTLVAVLRGDAPADSSAEAILTALPVVDHGDRDEAGLVQTVEDARANVDGWVTMPTAGSGGSATARTTASTKGTAA